MRKIDGLFSRVLGGRVSGFLLSGLAAAVVSGAARTSLAAPVVSTFDTDADGWTASGPGFIQYSPVFGNPGGAIQCDRNAIAPDTVAVAPAKFTGDQSANDGGTFSFDAAIASIQPTSNPLASFGTVSIYYNGLPTPITQDLAVGIPGLSYQTYSGSFSAPGFGVSPAVWSTAITNIDSLTIDFSTYDQVMAFSPVYLDNVILTPEPASVGMLGVAGVMLLRRRRM